MVTWFAVNSGIVKRSQVIYYAKISCGCEYLVERFTLDAYVGKIKHEKGACVVIADVGWLGTQMFSMAKNEFVKSMVFYMRSTWLWIWRWSTIQGIKYSYHKLLNWRHMLCAGLFLQGQHVGIMAINRPEWQLADTACFTQGIVSVPLYDTLGMNPHVFGSCVSDFLFFVWTKSNFVSQCSITGGLFNRPSWASVNARGVRRGQTWETFQSKGTLALQAWVWKVSIYSISRYLLYITGATVDFCGSWWRFVACTGYEERILLSGKRGHYGSHFSRFFGFVYAAGGWKKTYG